MRCEILFFAQLADIVGAARVTLELADDATAADAVSAIAGEHDGVAAIRAVIAVAVNERYASPDTTLADGDTVALIPPVSGG